MNVVSEVVGKSVITVISAKKCFLGDALVGFSIFDVSMMMADEPELGPYLGKLALFSVSSIFVALIIYSYSYAVIQKYRDDPEGSLMEKFFPYMRDITLRLFLLFVLYLVAMLLLGGVVFLLMSVLPLALNVILGFALFLSGRDRRDEACRKQANGSN